MNILHNNTTYNDPTFRIERYNNNLNIVQIATCNLLPNVPPLLNFSIDSKGFVGIGSVNPIAPLSISLVNSTIMDYSGINYGDKFNISEHAYVGIGTSTPKSFLSINRSDDLTESDIRINPLINMNIDYISASNYTTSNNASTIFNIIPYTSNILLPDNVTEVTCNLFNNNVLIDFITNTSIIPYIQTGVTYYNNNLQNNFYVYNKGL